MVLLTESERSWLLWNEPHQQGIVWEYPSAALPGPREVKLPREKSFLT